MKELTAAGTVFGTEFIKSLAKDMASFVKEKVSGYYTDTTYKELVDSEWAFEEYLIKTREKYYKSKSILYRTEERELSDFFEPVDLQINPERYRLRRRYFACDCERRRISTINISNLLEVGSKLVILGNGGTGKTILMKHLCVNSIDTAKKVPVFISLRWFNNIELQDKPFEKLIYDQMKTLHFELEYKYFLYSLQGDHYLFLFDGYDEIKKANRDLISQKLSDFSSQYGDNYFIITSRKVEDVFAWNRFTVFEVCPLEPKQAVQLIWKLKFDPGIKKRFIDEFQGELYEKYKSFASVPLLLSILFVVYNERTTLPETLKEFYEEAFSTLLYRHDNDKEGFKRELESKLGYEDFRSVFMYFCFRTYFDDHYSFSERQLIEYLNNTAKKLELGFDALSYKNDLLDVVSMLIRDGREYTFIHRSFQEYFAAYYVSVKPDGLQQKLCSGFIASESDLGLEDKNISLQSKLMDFLSMLYQIEPERYESVVVMPILEKINRLNDQYKGDLVEILSDYFLIEDLTEPEDNLYAAQYFYRYDIEAKDRVSYYDFKILFDFYLDAVNSSLHDTTFNQNLEKLYNEGVQRGYYLDDRRLYDDNVKYFVLGETEGTYDIFLYNDTYKCLLANLIIALKRYDEMIAIKKKKMSFSDMIESF